MVTKMTKKVLVIEDDTAMLDILSTKLGMAGLKVIKAQDGEEGLRLAQTELPDIILLDLVLPKMSGLDMLDALRNGEQGKSIPVFILTNLNENSSIYKSVALHTEAYFIKSNDSLEHIVTEVKNKLQPAK